MTPGAQIAALSAELVARVGRERAQIVIRLSRETLEKLISDHGIEVASQVGLTLSLIAQIQDLNAPTIGKN